MDSSLKKKETSTSPPWANRIVGHGELPPDQLLANPRNWRTHPANQQAALSGVLSDIGWLQEVIVNVRSSELWPIEQRNIHTLLDGHLRISLALRTSQPSVPVKYVDLPPHEEAEALLTFDPISAMAAADKEQLDSLMREVQSGDIGVQEILGKLAAHEGLYKFDPYSEWHGMPDFDQPDARPLKTILVHFKSENDLLAFGDIIGQKLSMSTRYIHYPFKDRENAKDFTWSDES